MTEIQNSKQMRCMSVTVPDDWTKAIVSSQYNRRGRFGHWILKFEIYL